ncbi:MAG: ATP-binding protein [Lachnospiraceae bacterium]|nr:ATP-binding protein [Lachnospiraceae bacterium]
MLNITKGKVNRAQKTVIYGPEGIGKTSLASCFPDPLIIDTEGGTAHMDVRRIEKPATWEELLSIIREVAATPGICKTLVIDTADWAEQLVTTYLCNKYKQNSIESFGYGKGYTYLAEEFAKLLAACDLVIAAGIHVVITAHAKMRKFEQPDEMGAYDRWELKLSKQVAPLLKEWADFLFFCNYQTFVVTTETNTAKAQGGKRVIYTTHHPAWDAKTREPLPEVIDLDFKNIAHLYAEKPAHPAQSKTAPAATGNTGTEKPVDRLRAMIREAGLTEQDIQKVVAAKGHYDITAPIDSYHERFITGWVIKYWSQILEYIKADHSDTN